MIARHRVLLLLALSIIATNPWPVIAAELDKAMWIWSDKFPAGSAPDGPVYFRKTFEAPAASAARLTLTCDNRFEAYLNGKRIGSGDDWKEPATFDVKAHLASGKNVLAIRGENQGAGAAGLAAVLEITPEYVKAGGEKSLTVASDATWQSSTLSSADWQAVDFDDKTWRVAQVFGAFGKTAPWSGAALAAAASPKERFKAADGFVVEEVAGPEQTGSLIAMTFDPQGNILCSKERGPVQIVRFKKDQPGVVESVSVFNEQVKNAQGILAYRGYVYVVSDGPQGTALYRIETAGDGTQKLKTLFKFVGNMGEHGPHQPIVGPDGLIYLMVGNHASAPQPFAKNSPHYGYYEGDLVRPRYEDANGHASGIKAPGGAVVRMDADGKNLELFSGGYRNAYDIAFNREGELFTYDSDMEWDENLPWYRPTRVNHITAGSEFGWRSGWNKWPDYFIDSLPMTADLGRGSPTGVEFYNHTLFPKKYHNVLFAADWSRGRIVAVTLDPKHGTYVGEPENFLTGNPLNVTDLAVGPRGDLYFSIGGRGTQGGLFRISPKDARYDDQPPTDMAGLLQAPQFYSVLHHQQAGKVKAALGPKWDSQLLAAAEDTSAGARRARALELMQLFGPAPTTKLLLAASEASEAEVRARAAFLMGLHSDDATKARLVKLLADDDARVQRVACEAIVRCKAQPKLADLMPLLGMQHRFHAWAARRVLETLPRESWEQEILASKQPPRVVIQGALALLMIDRDKAVVQKILKRLQAQLENHLSDDAKTDTLRIIEVALLLGEIPASECGELWKQLTKMYPSKSHSVNRELVRLLTYLQDATLAQRMVAQLGADIPESEKMHLAMHAPFLKPGWTRELRNAMLDYYDKTQSMQGGNSFKGYFQNAARDFISAFPPDHQAELLADGAKSPGMAIPLVRTLPLPLSAEHSVALQKLIASLPAQASGPTRDLSKEAFTALGRSGDKDSLTYLYEQFNTAPERRGEIAGALAQHAIAKGPRAEDWPLLVRSLPVVEGNTARDILKALTKYPNKPDTADPYRQVILLGLRLGGSGGSDARATLEHWAGKKLGKGGDSWDVALANWQEWFATTYPNQPEAKLPVMASGQKWSTAKLLGLLANKGSEGDAQRGAVVFDQAQCIKCHRYGPRGEGIGPDLTMVSSRFQRKEIVESVLFPSAVVSDQFAAKTVVTTAGQSFTGIIGPAGEDLIVLQPNGEKALIKKADIDEIVPSKKSAMPDGLFDKLTEQQIIDLFAYLAKPPQSK